MVPVYHIYLWFCDLSIYISSVQFLLISACVGRKAGRVYNSTHCNDEEGGFRKRRGIKDKGEGLRV